jgi:hypothetical protein
MIRATFVSSITDHHHENVPSLAATVEQAPFMKPSTEESLIQDRDYNTAPRDKSPAPHILNTHQSLVDVKGNK